MKSMLLLILFPTIILVLLYAFYAIMGWLNARNAYYPEPIDWDWVNTEFLGTLPWAVGIVGVWFVIAYLFNTSISAEISILNHLMRPEALTRL